MFSRASQAPQSPRLHSQILAVAPPRFSPPPTRTGLKIRVLQAIEVLKIIVMDRRASPTPPFYPPSPQVANSPYRSLRRPPPSAPTLAASPTRLTTLKAAPSSHLTTTLVPTASLHLPRPPPTLSFVDAR
ncbi:hypothetical protein BCR35DRAFT_144725 [Leucosporidium creatinivorum]|uniref:Uncharacterized protein n=1 Tax=Leucosporidium creatinivorum TaxID=106004 RepID=A0A1Y2ERD5_9BASI|nr:hypothetical protein BCR35DRAFT_144725 [Leucosporidium creatinivorum]